MSEEKIASKIQSIFIEHFNVKPDQFEWGHPLEVIQEDFKMLSYLELLENLLEKQFKKNISITKNISPVFHTPKNVLVLIMREL